MFKAYESKIYINRSINIEISGNIRVIEFRGGLTYPKKVYGIYGTGSLAEQKAIEDHPGFGKKFILKTEEIEKFKVKEEILLEPEIDTVIVDESVTTDNITEQEAVTIEVIPEITEEVVEATITEVLEVEKVQQGKEYLMARFPNEFTHRQLSNKGLVLEAAKEKNISFPNIP